jgi:hypothetical protein
MALFGTDLVIKTPFWWKKIRRNRDHETPSQRERGKGKGAFRKIEYQCLIDSKLELLKLDDSL